MTALFADTFYWIALADVADTAHQLLRQSGRLRTSFSGIETDKRA